MVICFINWDTIHSDLISARGEVSVLNYSLQKYLQLLTSENDIVLDQLQFSVVQAHKVM